MKEAGHPEDRVRERSTLDPDTLLAAARPKLKSIPEDGAEKYHWRVEEGGKLHGYLAIKRVGKKGRPVVATFLAPHMTPSGEDVSGHLGPLLKAAELRTELLPHQQRVVDRMKDPNQTGLVVVHGLGSGKTLSAIATQDALKSPATVVVPAALQENYAKEQRKHIKGTPPKTTLQTVQRVALDGSPASNPLLVVDEAHRLRDHTSASFQAMKTTDAEKRLLLTGSPFYNHPADIAPLVNLAAKQKILPMDRPEFEGKYIGIKKVSPGFIQEHLMGVAPGEVPVLNERNAPELREILSKYVDYHPGSKDHFPDVTREDVVVPMSPQQKDVYDTLMGQAPSWVSAKVRRGLPPNKKELAQMGSFLTAPRQVANTTAPYSEELNHSPKIDEAFKRLKSRIDKDPNAKAVIYSNFLDAGINPYKAKLQEAGIPFGEFTGEMKKKDRDQMVRDYNENKLKALLRSSAGGEGLDLKGTKLVQLLDPHWNAEKLKQVEGRAARFKSHDDLPEGERNVHVEQYLSGIKPGLVDRAGQFLFNRKPDETVDQYLNMMSKQKEALNKQFRDLLPNHEKKADAEYEEPSELRTKTLATLGYALPTQATASAGWLPHTGRSSFFPNLLGTQVVAAPVSYILANQNIKRQDAYPKNLAKAIAKKPSRESEVRDQAELSGLGLVAQSLKSALKGQALGSALAIIESRKPKHALPLMAVQAPFHLAGGIARTLMERDTARMALNRLESAKGTAEKDDERRLHRLKKEVARIESRRSTELLC